MLFSKKSTYSSLAMNPVLAVKYIDMELLSISYLLPPSCFVHLNLSRLCVYAVFFFPMLVSMLPNTHVTANTANMPSVMTTGFLYPAVHG